MLFIPKMKANVCAMEAMQILMMEMILHACSVKPIALLAFLMQMEHLPQLLY